MLKTTHEGMENARRRASARVLTAPANLSAVEEGSEEARATGCCASRRESIQIGLADIILRAPPGQLSGQRRANRSFANGAKTVGSSCFAFKELESL
jgi:hypothetical protein